MCSALQGLEDSLYPNIVCQREGVFEEKAEDIKQSPLETGRATQLGSRKHPIAVLEGAF